MVLLPCASSNTVPLLLAPPFEAVPKRLPLLSSTSPAWGNDPVALLKDARMLIVLLPAASSNTVPALLAPPDWVVPKKLPLLSWIKPPMGLAPLVPLKDARAVSVLSSCLSSSCPSSNCARRGRRVRIVFAEWRGHQVRARA